MASNRPLTASLTVTGQDQANLNRWMANMTDLMVEMQTDHATSKVTVDELVTLTTELRADHATARTEQIAIGTTLADFKAIYDAHTHTSDGNASRTSTPDTGSPVGSPSNASAFTDTSGSPPATLSAGAATAGPASLTNSGVPTLLKA